MRRRDFITLLGGAAAAEDAGGRISRSRAGARHGAGGRVPAWSRREWFAEHRNVEIEYRFADNRAIA
jgi:hypothetical protein